MPLYIYIYIYANLFALFYLESKGMLRIELQLLDASIEHERLAAIINNMDESYVN